METKHGYYQEISRDTYHEIKCNQDGMPYLVMGLLGETGEIANKIKKVYRDNDGHYTNEIVDDLKSEIGDVLWYLTQICTNLGLTLEEVAEHNYEKLRSRKQRNLISGSGDNR